jgi:DegV family protein with EDD domain
MTKIAFVTDSTAYLTPEQIENYDISVVPLSVIFGDKVFREGQDISTEQFYTMLSESKQLPTTSQPAVGEFVEVFEKLLQTHDTVMCYLLSSHFSGTFRSAETAARMVEGNVILVDSLIASYGIAGPLMDGIELARQGATPAEIVALWERERDASRALFVIDTLEFLHKGGRIGGAAAIFGALLQIKPILTVIDGRLELFEKVRTHKRAMDRMLEEFDKLASTGLPLSVGVVHSRRLGDAEKLRDDLVAQYPHIMAEISELGPVVGTHTGPGVLALLYYPRAES